MSGFLLLLLVAFAWIFFLQRRLKKSEARLEVLERGLNQAPDADAATVGAEGPEMPLPEEPEPAAPEDVPAELEPQPAEVVFGSGESAIRLAGAVEYAESGETAVRDPAPETPRAPGRDADRLEKTLGSRWAIWVGGLALALGGVFLVRYSIEQGLFGPAVRLSITAISGFLALGAGELIRRRDIRLAFAGDGAAYAPGILTAAGAAILFAVIYAAHGLYGFIGPAVAFALLGVISLATVGLSLRHGPLLAAFGLAGSYVTPALVSSQSPDARVLFSYLAVVLIASSVLARFRNRIWIINTALAGTALWAIGYASEMPQDEALALTIPVGTIVLAVVLIWERGRTNWLLPLTSYGRRRYRPVHLAIVALTLIALAAVSGSAHAQLQTRLLVGFAVLSLLLVAIARRSGWLAIVAAPYVAISAFFVWSRFGIESTLGLMSGQLVESSDLPAQAGYVLTVVTASTVLILAGTGMAGRLSRSNGHAVLWSICAVAAGLTGFGFSVLLYADLNIDVRYGAAAFALAAVFVAASWYVLLRQPPRQKGRGVVDIYLWAAAIAVGAGIHLLCSPDWTGISMAIAALLVAVTGQFWQIRSLAWISVAFAVVVVIRFGIDPAVAVELSRAPVLNWLLPGYYLPALSFGYCAVVFARDNKIAQQRVMEGLSATVAIVGAAVLIRHGMNDGILDGDGPATLGERTLYTLLSLGASATLIRLDDRSPSPVFRYGSMLVGYVGLGTAVYAHALTVNPLFNADIVGENPVFNLITAGYLLPSACAAAVWWFARSRRPRFYVVFLAAVALFFLLAWVGLAVRHFYNAPVLVHFLNPPASTLEAFSYMPAYLVVGLAAWLLSRLILAGMFATATKTTAVVALVIGLLVNIGFENPLLTNAPMGDHPLFNLIVLGYLVPAILMTVLSWLMRGGDGRIRRWLAASLGIGSGLMIFAWVSLTIRWYFQGVYIGAWKGALPAETYAYSAAWLVLGVAVLIIGQRLGSRSIRMASAALVALTVAKVFLIDMSELEGVLRAFSFMGLGVALIGIGLFYQRIFTSDRAKTTEGIQDATG